MNDDTEDLVKDIQMCLGPMEEQLTNLELRMTAQEQHL